MKLIQDMRGLACAIDTSPSSTPTTKGDSFHAPLAFEANLLPSQEGGTLQEQRQSCLERWPERQKAVSRKRQQRWHKDEEATQEGKEQENKVLARLVGNILSDFRQALPAGASMSSIIGSFPEECVSDLIMCHQVPSCCIILHIATPALQTHLSIRSILSAHPHTLILWPPQLLNEHGAMLKCPVVRFPVLAAQLLKPGEVFALSRGPDVNVGQSVRLRYGLRLTPKPHLLLVVRFSEHRQAAAEPHTYSSLGFYSGARDDTIKIIMSMRCTPSVLSFLQKLHLKATIIIT